MSRIGMQPITIENGVTVEVVGNMVTAKGAMGQLQLEIPAGLTVTVSDGVINLTRSNEEKLTKSLHGTIRSILANNVKGVKDGFVKQLELVGVGYRVAQQGPDISMKLGWNHPVVFKTVDGITLEVKDENTILVKGIDLQLVGEISAKIREMRKPEPYKGKGIRYEGEYVRRKERKVVGK